jgi:RNA polymerase sigma-70 factor, ECF subfamily
MRETTQTKTHEERRLIAACRQGDLDAFAVLVNRYQARMFTVAFRVTGVHEDAAEIVQDAFVAAYRGLPDFRGDAAFSTWLTTITVNLSRNRLQQLRLRRQREPVSLDDTLPGCEQCQMAQPASGEPSALDLLEQQDLRQRVQGCINSLEPGFREVLVLRDMEEYSYGEIGSMLSLAEGTVKSRISRAREAVRACLKKVLGEL